MPACLSACLPACLSVCLSACLPFFRLSVCLHACLIFVLGKKGYNGQTVDTYHEQELAALLESEAEEAQLSGRSAVSSSARVPDALLKAEAEEETKRVR